MSGTTSSPRFPLNDFVSGVATLLAPRGTATFEFPHLLHLLDRVEYDTIYHEHFSYFSLATIVEIFARTASRPSTCEELPPTADRFESSRSMRAAPGVARRQWQRSSRERRSGAAHPERYARFAEDVKESKRALLELLIRSSARESRSSDTAHPARATPSSTTAGSARISSTTRSTATLTSRARTRRDAHPDPSARAHRETRPDYIVVLPWNLIDEISAQLAYVAEWGAQLIVPIPRATVIEPGQRRTRKRLAAARELGTARMKVVIFCGGMGVRMGDATQRIPEADDPDRESARSSGTS